MRPSNFYVDAIGKIVQEFICENIKIRVFYCCIDDDDVLERTYDNIIQ